MSAIDPADALQVGIFELLSGDHSGGFRDDFNGSAVNVYPSGYWQSTFGTVVVSGGHASLTCDADYSLIDGPSPFPNYPPFTGQGVDMRGSSRFTVEMSAVPTVSSGQVDVYIALFSNALWSWQIQYDGTHLNAIHELNQVRTNIGSAPFVLGSMKFWRIRTEGNNVFWEYGPDGVSWSQLATAPIELPQVKNMGSELGAGTFPNAVLTSDKWVLESFETVLNEGSLDGTSIYDGVPGDVTLSPGEGYVVIGEMTAVPDGVHGKEGRATSAVLHTWTRAESHRPGNKIGARIVALLAHRGVDLDPLVAGHSVGRIEHEFSQTLVDPEPGIRHRVDRFRIWTQED